jgi:hypothetical protein
MTCPLCKSDKEKEVFSAKKRVFYKCGECNLICAHPQDLPDANEEKERYQLHHNSLGDVQYLKFLSQAIEPVKHLLKKESKILDYGCGPVPALQHLLKTKGPKCEIFDPFFFPKKPTGKFDFIFSTETFEHFHFPVEELETINNLLSPNGYLIIMTEFYPETSSFEHWHYIRDFTHVSFYNSETFDWIADNFNLKIEYTDKKRVVVLRRSLP